MFVLQAPAWEIIARSALVYLALLAGLRLAGKREIGQLTIFDLVVLLLISNAVQNAMVGADTSLLGGLIAAAVLLVLNLIVAQARMRSARLRRLIEGSPTLLVLHGRILEDHMRREGLDEDTLEAALREHGVPDIGGVEMAVLEIDGSISVVPKGVPTKKVARPARYVRR